MPTVLAVDDERHLLTMYERLLCHIGFAVITAASLAEALRRLHDAPIALVIADLRLPDGDGMDIVRAARRMPSPIPCIVVTGCGLEAAEDAANEAGADRFFAKPFRLAALTASIRELTAAQPRTVAAESAT